MILNTRNQMKYFSGMPKTILILLFLLAGISACLSLPGSCLAKTRTDPRSQYLQADHCYKQLRHSPSRQQRVLEWISCIKKYETIADKHPDSSWAPAGMYKAADLYMKLFSLSKDPIHRFRAGHLLFRTWKQYPQSAYSPRAKKRFQSMDFDQTAFSSTHVRSQKAQTRKKQMDKEKSLPAPSSAPESSPPQKTDSGTGKDILVTDLRFWSNPEYTRIVIDVSGKCPFSHHLLKKDPSIKVAVKRLYLDIGNAKLGNNLPAHTPINDNLLKQTRAGQFTPHTVRVVVDIKSFRQYKVFSLQDPFRIVIDVWGDPQKKQETQENIQADKSPRSDLKAKQMNRINTDKLKSSSIARQLALGVRKIIIDPGHGGRDPGAPGAIKGVWEKDIVLKLSKTLAQKLRKRLNCTVILTRTTDRKLTLEERTAMANTQRADLFISMHCNAAVNKKIKGIETYLLNLATDEHAIAVAARENATSQKNISDLEFILSDLMKHAKIKESSRLAHDVQNALVRKMKKKHTHIKDLGVKQAPFYVLLGARMPSILVEAGFLSNPKECKRLMNASYRDDICTGIANGVEAYIRATNPVRR